MTGRIVFRPYYGDALAYCLQDKRVRQEETQDQTKTESQRVKNRAEVLHYNLCYGKEKELARQFKAVQKQDLKISKPAFHLSLSFAPGENVSKGRLADIAKECARELGFEEHQYIAVMHKDTAHPHIHIVANRIGFDGHVMEDRHILPRVLKFCRETEQRYQLTPVKNIYRYRSPEERTEQRKDPRTMRLKEDIRQVLTEAYDPDGFRERIRERGYKVYQNEKGIAFMDGDGAIIQGYKTGYPWKAIEAELGQNLARRQEQLRLEQKEAKKLEMKHRRDPGPRQELTLHRGHRMRM